MCQPFFEIEDLCFRENVSVFSSNYELYANLSGRMMSTIASLTDSIDPYSIDECFENMTGYEQLNINLTELGFQIKERMLQNVGIPTCVGIAPTKTLAKYCNHLAKHYRGLNGVCNWLDLTPQRQAKALACEPVSEIWGVGRRYTERLNLMGIETALDLSRADPIKIRKQIMRSRSFNSLVTAKEDLIGALTLHAQECGCTLRKEGSYAQVVGIVLNTNSFRTQDPQYHAYPCIGLEYPISDTRTLIRCALKLLDKYYRSGYLYKRAGVYVGEVIPEKTPLESCLLRRKTPDKTFSAGSLTRLMTDTANKH